MVIRCPLVTITKTKKGLLLKKSRAVWVLESRVSGLRLGLMVTKRERYGPFFVDTYDL